MLGTILADYEAYTVCKSSIKLDNIIIFSSVFNNSNIIHSPMTDDISYVKTKRKFSFLSSDFLPKCTQ